MLHRKVWFRFEKQFSHHLQNIQGQKTIGNFPWGKPRKLQKKYVMKQIFTSKKPIKVDDFNKVEEKEVKKRVEKQKHKRREVAEKNKLLKKKKTGGI